VGPKKKTKRKSESKGEAERRPGFRKIEHWEKGKRGWRRGVSDIEKGGGMNPPRMEHGPEEKCNRFQKTHPNRGDRGERR